MITQHFLSYLFNNWEETLGDEFFLLPLHCGGVVDLHLKYSMKSKMGVRSRTPAQKYPWFCCFVLPSQFVQPGSDVFDDSSSTCWLPGRPTPGYELWIWRLPPSLWSRQCGREEDEEVRITSYKRLRKKWKWNVNFVTSQEMVKVEKFECALRNTLNFIFSTRRTTLTNLSKSLL